MKNIISIIISAILSLSASHAQQSVNLQDTKPGDISQLTAMVYESSDTISDISRDSSGGKKEEYDKVEIPAKFKGRDLNSFREWVTKKMKYPEIAAENGIQGKVYVEFSINKHGDVVNVKVLRSVDPSLDKEAIRVIKSSPRWKPAKKDGKPVIQQFIIPLSFYLE